MSSELPLGVLTTTPAVSAPVRAVSAPLALPGTGRDDAGSIPAAPQPAVNRDVLAQAAQRVADSLGSGNSFSFAVDNQTGITIVRVINKATGELVRQIPTEEVVRVAQLLQQDEHQKVLDVRV
jgi:flagellar protein FlaG